MSVACRPWLTGHWQYRLLGAPGISSLLHQYDIVIDVKLGARVLVRITYMYGISPPQLTIPFFPFCPVCLLPLWLASGALHSVLLSLLRGVGRHNLGAFRGVKPAGLACPSVLFTGPYEVSTSGAFAGVVARALFACCWSRSRTCQQLRQDQVPLYNSTALCLARLICTEYGFLRRMRRIWCTARGTGVGTARCRCCAPGASTVHLEK